MGFQSPLNLTRPPISTEQIDTISLSLQEPSLILCVVHIKTNRCVCAIKLMYKFLKREGEGLYNMGRQYLTANENFEMYFT